MVIIHTSSQQLWLPKHDPHKMKQFKISGMDGGVATKTPFLGRVATKTPSLAEELLVVDGYWGKESLFFMCVLRWWSLVDCLSPSKLSYAIHI